MMKYIFIIMMIVSQLCIADEKGDMLLKATIKRPACYVNVSSMIDLGEILAASPESSQKKEYISGFSGFDVDISCDGGAAITSWIQLSSAGTPGELISGGGAKFISMALSNGSVADSSLQLGLAYLEKDNTSVGVFDNNLNAYLAAINTVADANSTSKYCQGNGDRVCRFKPVIVLNSQGINSDGSGSLTDSVLNGPNSYEQSITFTLTYD